MAFTLKKIIAFFLMPLSIIFVLFLVGLFFLWLKQYKKAKLFLVTSFCLLFLAGFTPFSNMLVKPLENQYEKVKNYQNDIEYVLLLGGGLKTRSYEALRLYHQYDNIKIITSGYGGYEPISDAKRAADKLMSVGVKKEDIIIEEKSQDTHDEAVMMKRHVQGKPFYLVTSALHMPRAMKTFEKEGLNPIAAPTDFIQVEYLGALNLFNAGNVLAVQKAMHEYLGIAYSNIKNMIIEIKGHF